MYLHDKPGVPFGPESPKKRIQAVFEYNLYQVMEEDSFVHQ